MGHSPKEKSFFKIIDWAARLKSHSHFREYGKPKTRTAQYIFDILTLSREDQDLFFKEDFKDLLLNPGALRDYRACNITEEEQLIKAAFEYSDHL